MKNQFALIRQTYNIDDVTVTETDPPVGDLIGMYFPLIPFLGDCAVEVIEPEWVEDHYISSSSTGATAEKEGYHYCITDVSDYDMVILPNLKAGSDSLIYNTSGMCHGPNTEINPRCAYAVPADYAFDSIAYICFKVDPNNNQDYAAVCCANKSNTPILGIKTKPI